MRANPVFSRAAAALASPPALLGMALMLLNDLLLKRLWPSWLTGKLSDVGGLLFLPLLAAALLALVLPARLRREKLVAGLAFALTGGVFALVKLLPEAAAALTDLYRGVGIPANVRPDPGDLLALPALAVAWNLCKKPPAPALAKTWRLAMVPLAALLLLGDAAAPDYGITCLNVDNGMLKAQALYRMTYIDGDGGLAWSESALFLGEDCQMRGDEPLTAETPDGRTRYRIQDDWVQSSSDGGSTWINDFYLKPVTQSEQAYASRMIGGSAQVSGRPLDMLVDPRSGNLLIAMGHEGILTRRADTGEWVRVPVGPYRPAMLRADGLAGMLNLLLGEVVMAAALALLLVALFAARRQHGRAAGWLVGIGLAGWLAALVIFPPALATGAYSGAFVAVAAGTVIVWALIAALVALIRARGRHFWQMLALALLAALLFLLPFVAWGLGWLPQYFIALAIGVALVAIVALSGLRAVGRGAAPVAEKV